MYAQLKHQVLFGSPCSISSCVFFIIYHTCRTNCGILSTRFTVLQGAIASSTIWFPSILSSSVLWCKAEITMIRVSSSTSWYRDSPEHRSPQNQLAAIFCCIILLYNEPERRKLTTPFQCNNNWLTTRANYPP